jgi:uncharacterized protein YqgV (UPF0045/DUF77 family)
MSGQKKITAQLSLYALGREAYKSEVDDAISTLDGLGLKPRVGALSTTVSGEPDQVFSAIRTLFDQANETGPSVLTVTLANATPDEILGGKYPQP